MSKAAIHRQLGIAAGGARERDERVEECRTRLDAHGLVELEVRWGSERGRW